MKPDDINGFDELFDQAEPSEEFLSHMEIAEVLGFPQNERRMRMSVNPRDLRSDGERAEVELVDLLINRGEFTNQCLPVAGARPIRFWIHYRESDA
jgi:hypothetical protein